MPPVTQRVVIIHDPLNDNAYHIHEACRSCRKKKVKCDGNLEGCSRCKMLGISCSFGSQIVRRGRPRSRFLQQNEQIIFDISNPILSQISQSFKENLLQRYMKYLDKYENLIVGIELDLPPDININLGWDMPWNRGRKFTHAPYMKKLSNDMLGILIEKVSSLSIGEKIIKTFPMVQVRKEERQLANRVFEHRDPLKSITYEQALLFINTWFQTHSFPTILNRTVMTRNFRNNNYDPLLYSAVFASALNMSGIPIYNQTRSRRPGSVFTEYALSLLEKETPEPSLTKMQGLFILGGHLIYLCQSKMGMPLVATAWKMALQLRIHEQDSECFNLQLDPVERELRNNMWWVLRSSMTWGYFNAGSGIDKIFFEAKVNMPVKNESESALYALDQAHGLNTTMIEHGQAIRSFYNFVHMSVIFSEIWLMITPDVGRRSLLDPEEGELVCEKLPSSRGDLATLPAHLAMLANALPSDLAPLNAAELLLYYNILLIHLHFPKNFEGPLLIVEESLLAECVGPADSVVDIAENILNDLNGVILHPLVVYGLNTSACIHILIAESRTGNQRQQAILNLHRTLKLLECKQLVIFNRRLIRAIEEALGRLESRQVQVARLESENEENFSRQANKPIIIPHVSLESIAKIETTGLEDSLEKALMAVIIPTLDLSQTVPSSLFDFSIPIEHSLPTHPDVKWFENIDTSLEGYDPIQLQERATELISLSKNNFGSNVRSTAAHDTQVQFPPGLSLYPNGTIPPAMRDVTNSEYGQNAYSTISNFNYNI
ncbi:uncharacterized protein VTP21DRAFT_8057 [Calcarisporiella thermophila]|uniref:uncharacterized protein n=1 Tax=Calcarisporiella thermophila TaxID=911321 RepID=UPI003743AA18